MQTRKEQDLQAATAKVDQTLTQTLRPPRELRPALSAHDVARAIVVAPSLAPTCSRSLAPTCLQSLAPTYSVTCAHIRPTTAERGEGEGGGRGGRMIATLFHAASTTTSSHDHIQSPTPPARPVTRLATGERGEGEGGEGGEGSPTRPARPVTRRATGEREGEGGA